MFNYTQFTNDLIKAMTHKYVRRIPKGVTKTGATKYVYYYAGQEGHSKGIAHESEIVQGASFAFGEHGKTRYHAHISKVDGDKVTVKYDDGDKKGTEETMTKKQFQSMIHGEHATGIKQAKEKAEKQLKDFQAGKAKGVKVRQETLDKLEQRVKNLDELTTKEKDAQLGIIKEGISKLSTPLPVKQVSPNFQGVIDAPVIHLGIFGKSTLRYIDPTVHKNVFIEKTAEHLNLYVEKANKSGDIMLLRSTPSKQPEVTFSVSVPTKQLQDILGQDRIGATPSFKYKDNTLFFKSNIPFDDPVYFGRRTESKTDENNFYKIDGSNWQKPEVKQGTPQQKGADAVIERLKKYQDLSNLADSLSYSDHVIYEPGVHVRRGDYDNILTSDTIKNKAPDRYKTLEQLKQDLIVSDRVNLKGDLVDDDYKNMLDSLEATEKSKDPPVVAVSKRWDIKEKARWEKIIKPALKALGLPAGELHHVNKTKKINVVDYKIPLHFLNSKPEGPEQALKDLFDDTKVPEVKYAPLTEKQQNLITKYNKSDVKGFKSFVFEDDSVGDEIENEEMGSKDPDKLYIYAEGTYADREALNKLGFKFVQKKEGEKNVSYYKYKAPISKL